MGWKKLKNPPELPQLTGAHLLGRICLHPSKSSQPVRHKVVSECKNLADSTEISAQPPSSNRLKEVVRGKKCRLADRFSEFLSSHPGDRPWRRSENDLPLWDPRAALANKAAVLTAKIASDFCAWYRALGGDPVVDEQSVQQMFSIHFPEPARAATAVHVRELERREVPKTLLEKLSLLQPQEVQSISRKRQPRVAFGRCVPCQRPCSRRPKSQAPVLPQPPKGLLELRPVFEDITELSITKGYCELLEEHSQVSRPAFLVKQGFVPPSLKQ